MEIDYEKEYTEALERAKRLRDSKYQTMNAKRVAEEIFPQLAESEDEKIRKALVWHLKADVDFVSNGVTKAECIAYLEKQKDQKPAGCADDVVEEAEEYTSKVSCGEYGVEVTEAYIAGVLSERNRGTWWSEKDERMRNQLIRDVEHHKKEGLISAKQNKATKALYSEIEKCYDEKIVWLKSLRPQPKVELTLLDENIIEAAVAFVEQNNHFNCWRGVDKHTVIKALRSLKPRWKPSEEQMRFLLAVINDPNNAGSESCHLVLKELYEQLKTL